ncbi:NAD(P) transhydrogenase subunit alpha [Frateuria defendens]|uniref:NAD(P) transhydrogenase subunit alpha n=1 Tax=Frateuria defendens TaxID=2219559 RepID=UPI00066FEB00|nr:NAD(P) transhydrogenase subunit alpha [Frateuria defendens]
MSLKIAVLKETRADERRVAVVPSLVARFAKLGAEVVVQAGAGEAARFTDADYAPARIEPDARRLVADADIVLAVQAPATELAAAMKPGAVLASFVYAQKEPALLKALRDARLSAFAMETVPRISRAQSLDALSSQAALAGYYAPLLGAVQLPRILPMMTTAVGSLRAARVLVMGLGVAGLQALATAHRLGAVTEGYDVRPETREQAQSVGAKFVDTGVDARGEGGYARELTPEEQARAREALTRHIQQADLIVTTANVPGRAAPRLIDRAQIEGMKRGSVIVDLAADSGGNCEGTVPGQTAEVGPATILAPFNVPSLLAQHASELYAKNLLNLLELIVKDGALALDLADEVVGGTLLAHGGEIRNAAARAFLQSLDKEIPA